MRNGKHCPGCGKDIGIWPVLTAGLPSWVRCPHCKARLSYGRSGALILNLFCLLLLLSFGIFYFVGRRYAAGGLWFHLFLVSLILAAWVPVEFAATLYLRSRGELEKLL
jgi:hypothetical protein